MKPQLGQVMVDHGLITPEQLAHALAEQERLGRPLGKLLVELGFVSEGAVANALAEQAGGLLKTEFGISAGFHEAAEAAPDPRPAALQARVDELEAERVALHDHVREVRAFAERALARIAELEAAQPVAAEPEPERAHLLFVPLPTGYALLEREGPPPASGALVDVDGLGFRIVRVGCAPLPGRDLRCAFLLHI